MLTLDQIEAFKKSPEMRAELEALGSTKIFAENELILAENSYIKVIPIVLEGSIRVMRKDKDGREILLYYIQSGESCIMSFLGGLHEEKSKVYAYAEELTTILLIPMDKVGSLIKDYPHWLDYIFRLYHKRFEELLEVVDVVTFKKMDERLLHFIQNKAKLMKSSIIHLTHEQIAMEIGTSRVVVSRLLKQFEQRGVLKLGRNEVEII